MQQDACNPEKKTKGQRLMTTSVFLSLRHFAAAAAMALLMAAGVSLPAIAQDRLDVDLLYQASLGNATEVKETLALGANPNAANNDRVPALSVAASRTDAQALPIAQALVDKGASLEARDPSGNTPLMSAIAANNLPLVEY